jgi:hypothetical protein
MVLERRPIFAAGMVATFGALVVAGVIAVAVGFSQQGERAPTKPITASPRLSPSPALSWSAIPPATVVPADTPVQQQYDQVLASGLGSSPGLRAAEEAGVPTPAFSPAWPALPAANTPEQWVLQFSQRLLDIDFARQSRAGLGGWLSAEEAPELLPGVPATVASKVLYLSLFDGAAVGGNPSFVPDLLAWRADTLDGVRWSVSNLLVQPDPQFSQIVASGWQPVDQRFAVEDVSGLLNITKGTASRVRHFSMAVYVGSARWHRGYGTVLVSNWKET